MSLSLHSAHGVRIAVLNGAVDNSSGSDLVTTVKSSVEKGSTLVLDCTLVPSMDVAGFRHLLALHRWSQQGNGRVILAGMGPEAWALIVENHCENTFESKPSVAAALQSLGVSEDPALEEEAPPSADFAVPPTPFPEADSGIFAMPQSGSAASAWPAGENDSSPEPAWNKTGAGEDGWESFDKRQSAHSGETENVRKKKPRAGLIIGLVTAAVVLVAGGIWLKGYLTPPQIAVSEASIEVNEGQELPDVQIKVTDGQLDFDAIELPEGIDFSDGEEVNGTWEYYFGGTPKKSGVQTVVLMASRGSRKATPVEIVIDVREKKMEWLFSQPPMQEKKAISKTQYAKVVAGAQAVDLRWSGEPLEGLEVTEMAGAKGTWQISGTPAKAGTFQAQFQATSKGGKAETKVYAIKVEAAPAPPPPPPEPEPGPLVDSTTPAGQPKPGSEQPSSAQGATGAASAPPAPAPPPGPGGEDVSAINDRMRTFLLERIEKANSHFTDADKELLRTVVGRLLEAQIISTVKFGNAQARPSASEAVELKEALKRPDVQKLLEDPDCQILVVGYASTTGSHARNVKFSQQRAKAVNDILRDELGRSADLCGDYGPTDIVSADEAGNRVVEVYAGKIKVSKLEQATADMFKSEFNKRHGGR